MSQNDGLDRRLTAWLDDEAAPYAPTDLRMRFADGVGRTRQRPAWATTERWISMETRARLGGVPRLIIILATIGLLAALAAGAIVIGSDGPRPQQWPHRLRLRGRHLHGRAGRHRPAASRRRVGYPRTVVVTRWDAAGVLVGGGIRCHGSSWSSMPTARTPSWSPRKTMEGDISGYGVPAWSPDGSKLAFTARTLGGPQTACVGSSDVAPSFCSSRVFVAAADGSTGAVQVGDPDLAARTAAWSPDGSMIAFNGGGDAEKGTGLYLMDADGTDVRRLDTVSGTGWAFLRLDWSPDGKSIAATAGMETWRTCGSSRPTAAGRRWSRRRRPGVPRTRCSRPTAPTGPWPGGGSGGLSPRRGARRRRWQASVAWTSGRRTACSSRRRRTPRLVTSSSSTATVRSSRRSRTSARTVSQLATAPRIGTLLGSSCLAPRRYAPRREADHRRPRDRPAAMSGGTCVPRASCGPPGPPTSKIEALRSFATHNL